MSGQSNEERALVPRLRFPEFRDTGEWEAKQLDSICEVNPSCPTLPETFVYIDLESVEAGELKARKVIKREEAPSRAQRLLKIGDVIYQIVRPYQRNNFLFFCDNDHYVASTGYTQLRAFESQRFLYQLVHTDDFVERVLEKCTGSNYPAINSSDLATINVAVPKSKEQQKIADCLSSLDELITSESQKLDTLKTHKKGLMQQLFPREGETVPRLRFPEFRDAGEWEEVALGDVCERIMDGTHFSPTSKSGPYLYVTSKNVRPGALVLDDVSYISEEEHLSIFARCSVKKNDLLLTKDGASTGNCTLNPLDFEFSLLSSVAVIRGNREKILQEFLAQDFQSRHVQEQIFDATSGQAITRITLEKIKRFKVWFTSFHEQKKIADTLFSFDALISAQGQKIDAFRTHKKGLMQQLFPMPEED